MSSSDRQFQHIPRYKHFAKVPFYQAPSDIERHSLLCFIILRMWHILTVSPGCASSYFTHAWRYTPIVKDRILSVINLQHAHLQIRRCSLKRDTLEIAWSRWKLSRCSLQYKSRYTRLWKLLVRMVHEINSTLSGGSIAPQAWLTQP